MIQKCKECGGELKPKTEFFKQGGSSKYNKMKQRFKKKFGEEFPDPTGYNCIKCGACYDANFKREKYNIGWL